MFLLLFGDLSLLLDEKLDDDNDERMQLLLLDNNNPITRLHTNSKNSFLDECKSDDSAILYIYMNIKNNNHNDF